MLEITTSPVTLSVKEPFNNLKPRQHFFARNRGIYRKSRNGIRDAWQEIIIV